MHRGIPVRQGAAQLPPHLLWRLWHLPVGLQEQPACAPRPVARAPPRAAPARLLANHANCANRTNRVSLACVSQL